MAGDAARAEVPQFYAHRAVLITGASGFMGKVLVERLLATCPDVGPLFLLLRAQRHAPPAQRLRQLLDSPAFDNLRRSNPSQLEKLRVLPGDICQPGLGLSADSVAQLSAVSVIFNCAATVRFTEALRPALEQNTASVERLLELADGLDKVEVVVQVSTAYCNSEHQVIEERVYPPPRPLRLLLDDARAVPDEAGDERVRRFIAPKQNTYTFTKALGEAVVEQHGCRRYPIAIFRPTIVVPSLRHPMPGWVDSYAGSVGVAMGIGSGLLRTIELLPSAACDLIPVDMAIDTMICCAWETAVDKAAAARVYTCSSGANRLTWGRVYGVVLALARAHPLADARAYPGCFLTPNRLLHKILESVLQTGPLYIAEYVLRIFNYKKKVDLIRVAAQLSSLTAAVSPFTTREWAFATGHVQRLHARLSAADQRIYNIDPNTINWESYMEDYMRGCRLYLAKNKEEDLPEARKRLRRIYLIQTGVTTLLPLLLAGRWLRSSLGLARAAAALRAALRRLCPAALLRYL